MRSILSELLRQGRLIVVESMALASNKTKELVGKLKALGLDNALIITDSVDQNLYLAARNLYRVDVRDAAGIDPVNLVRFENVLVTKTALKQIEEMLG